jgi:PKD domain/RTX calcium-binding nonapeptide repeat (4 copies)
MWLATFLARLKSDSRRDRGRCPKRHRRPDFVPRLETLEDRTVPAPLILGTGTEPFVAVDPNNASNVVVGSNRFGAMFSTDGGQTFGAPTTPAGYRGDSGLAVDTQGRVFSSYLITDSLNANLLDVAVSNTTFGAQSLSSPGLVISRAGVSDDKELIAADHYAGSAFTDNLYVAWRRLNPEFVLYSRSTNNGANWTLPVPIATPSGGAPLGGFTSGADPEVAPNHNVYVLYWNGRNAGGDQGEVRVRISTDGGVTFPTDVLVSGARGTAGQDATGLDHNAGLVRNQLPNQSFRRDARTEIDLEADPARPGFLYAVWSTDPDGTTAGDAADAMFARSTDGGLTWSAPVVLNDDGGTLSQFQPSVAVDELGNVAVIWMDERLSANTSDPTLAVFATVSTDGGATFCPNFQIAGSSFDPDAGGATTFIGDYIKVAAANGVAFPAWTQTNAAGTNQIAFDTFDIVTRVTAPGTQNVVEGNSQAINLGSFGDVCGGPWTVDVDWGDGTPHTTFNAATAGALGAQAHTYAEEGSYTVTVTVTDGGAGETDSDSKTFQVAVSDPAVIPTAVPVTAVEGADTGPVAVATFTDPGGAEPVADYSAVIDWGDGTATTAGTISFAAGTFAVSGSHTYAEESAADHPGSGPYDITVTISHDVAPNAVVHSTAVVSDPAVIATGGFAFVAVEGDPSADQPVAGFTDPGGAEPVGDYSAVIDWGDGTTSVGTITTGFEGVFTVSGGHTYAVGLGTPSDFGNTFCDADPPSYHKPITVTVSHEDAPTAQAVSDAKISLKPGSAHLATDGSLIVVGTPADDSVVINNVGGKTGTVTVQLGSAVLGTFTVGPAGRIVVAAMGGDDSVHVAGGITVETVLYGGPGNDRLKGGGGRNILIGCEGDDTVSAGNLGDLMVGGGGADRLVGGNGNDLLVAGLLLDGDNNEDDRYDDLVAILAAGAISGPLHAGDDGAVDKLTGGGGTDTFYYNFEGGGVPDIVTDSWELRFDV